MPRFSLWCRWGFRGSREAEVQSRKIRGQRRETKGGTCWTTAEMQPRGGTRQGTKGLQNSVLAVLGATGRPATDRGQ